MVFKRLKFQPGGKERLAQLKSKLEQSEQDKQLVDRLITYVETGAADELARMRAYAIADEWQADRKQMLVLFLHATRAGLLEMQWEFICPLCRGPQKVASSLTEAEPVLHCHRCSTNFDVNFDKTIELNFRPSGSIRKIPAIKPGPVTDDGRAVTAAEVTALQAFRDLFASEAVRQNEPFSVGSMTVAFTDLKGSTKMYQEIGDAPAFGLVINHFDVIKDAIARYDGAIVKNIGDAIMAVFLRPANAIKAMLEAQKILAQPMKNGRPLTLRSGMHYGPCIAVSLNQRIDYFGTTVNKAARLEGKSSGNDVVISEDVYLDPEVQAMVSTGEYAAEPFEDELKGFEGKAKLWRIRKTS